jgi:sugar/nucleoside kinase (ribokinase family)
VLVCTLGDLLLDVIVRLGEPLRWGADTSSETRTGAGGQAANVAAWAVELGAQARFVGKRAGDAAGLLATAELRARGVDVVGPEIDGRNGVVVSLVGSDGDRTMATDRGVAPELSAGELADAWFACDWLHVAGYSLLRSPIDAAAVRAVELARAAGANVSVDLSSWSAIRAYGAARFRERLEAIRPDVVFANEAELEIVGGDAPAREVVLKRGARGIVVGGVERSVDAVAAIDSTGAGDALAAGYIVGDVELALRAAARCVTQLGTMP